MKDYNGFTSAQRSKAQRWLNAQWGARTFHRPTVCCACGQRHGVIDAHAEDYSEPFTYEKLMSYPLCFICHMMVHCRFRNFPVWDAYREKVREGWRYPAFNGRNFPGFIAAFFNGATFPAGEQFDRPEQTRYPLDVIAASDRRTAPPA